MLSVVTINFIKLTRKLENYIAGFGKENYIKILQLVKQKSLSF